LQHVVPEPDREVEVIEKVRETGADGVWHNLFISPSQRFDSVDRERIVEPERGVIDPLKRIIHFLDWFIGELVC
jgi:hypothetical protein